MTKARIHFFSMLLVFALLLSYRFTGQIFHAMVALVGVILSVIFHLPFNKEEWESPVGEAVMRLSYLAAVITGTLLMRFELPPIFRPLHIIPSLVSLILLIVLYGRKAFPRKR